MPRRCWSSYIDAAPRPVRGRADLCSPGRGWDQDRPEHLLRRQDAGRPRPGRFSDARAGAEIRQVHKDNLRASTACARSTPSWTGSGIGCPVHRGTADARRRACEGISRDEGPHDHPDRRRRTPVRRPGAAAVRRRRTQPALGGGHHLLPHLRPGGSTPRSSSTCSPAGSWAGRSRPACAPTWPWTPSRWGCGPGSRAGHDLTGLIHHSDRGVQYLAVRYTERLAEAGAVASVGSRGDSYDNALAEAFNSLFKAELIRNPHRPDGGWKSIDDLEIAVAEYIDWFNHRRLHGEIGHVPPAEYEANHYSEIPVLTEAGTK